MKNITNVFISYVFFFLYSFFVQAESLVIVSPHWDGFRREFEWGFQDWIKNKGIKDSDVTFRWLDLGGASDIAKTLIARKNAGSPLEIDILFGGGVDSFESLKSKGLLLSYDCKERSLQSIPQSINGNPLYDPDGYWYGVNITSFGFAINRELLKRLDILEPKRFEDLVSPQFRTLIGSADPRKSGSVRFIYELILQRYGWEHGWQLLYQITSNIRSFNNNSSQSPKDLSTGDVAIAFLIDSYGLDVESKFGSDKIHFTVPDDLRSFFADPVAIGVDGKNHDLAKLFVDFCLSREGQRLLLKNSGSSSGPKKYTLARLPVAPNTYTETPPSEKSRAEDPFSMNQSSFLYDAKTAKLRWQVVTKLLGAILVDNKDALAKMRYVDKIDLSKSLPPVSEAELHALINEQQGGSAENLFTLESSILKIRTDALEKLKMQTYK
jgi:iron(III) transport system substrate-binding protein